jgi:hypothetical protein
MLARIFVFMALASSVGGLHAMPCEDDDALIAEIVANDECIAEYAEEKIYLKSERIIPTNEGLFLNLNHRDYIPLRTLNSDDNGCYVQCRFLKPSICPNCRREYVGICGNKECPGKEKVREYEREKKRKKEEYKQKKKEEKLKK